MNIQIYETEHFPTKLTKIIKQYISVNKCITLYTYYLIPQLSKHDSVINPNLQMRLVKLTEVKKLT